MCHESGCLSPHYSYTSPMDYNSHHSLHYDTHISTIALITQLSPITNQPWLSCHTCTSFTHPHISSTLPYTRGEVLFRLTFLSGSPVFCFPVFTWTAYILWRFAACLFDSACLSISSLSAACPDLCIAPVADSALPTWHLLLPLTPACLT